nr:UDP-N-acetylglucosamine 2-epimerase (non-hydrolyzing) [uncultured Dyadobacter sp.]
MCVMGARPNFIKVAALYRALVKCPEFSVMLVHTGQHHDDAMFKIFVEQLELPEPAFFLGVHGGSHTTQTARIMLAFEKVVRGELPDMIMVVGDVNSSLACALVASKEGVGLVHVEAGLRSGDKSMPEEVNRILIDHIADELFVSEASAMSNLESENIARDKIHFVGNVMIDSLVQFRGKASRLTVFAQLGLASRDYMVLTMHRPSNVDSFEELTGLIDLIKAICEVRTVVFPVHPRTKSNLIRHEMWESLEKIEGLILLPPQGYLEFINLMENALLVITDSGGVQEETTFLKVPCVTLRTTTERPVTVKEGTNYLVGGMAAELVLPVVKDIIENNKRTSSLPALWDGQASDRIVQVIKKKYVK